MTDYYIDSSERQPIVERLRRDGRVDDRRVQIRRQNGEPFWVLASSRLVTWHGEPAVLTVFHDISEQLAAEAVAQGQRAAAGGAERRADEPHRALHQSRASGSTNGCGASSRFPRTRCTSSASACGGSTTARSSIRCVGPVPPRRRTSTNQGPSLHRQRRARLLRRARARARDRRRRRPDRSAHARVPRRLPRPERHRRHARRAAAARQRDGRRALRRARRRRRARGRSTSRTSPSRSPT